jgi:hypothetical protein
MILWTMTSSPVFSVDVLAHRDRSQLMPKSLKRGDIVEWNSEAGRVRGVIIKKIVSNLRLKGYVHHASATDPQYLIKSVKTDHIAIHKGKALTRVRAKKQ